jgi:hypothetical protein
MMEEGWKAAIHCDNQEYLEECLETKYASYEMMAFATKHKSENCIQLLREKLSNGRATYYPSRKYNKPNKYGGCPYLSEIIRNRDFSERTLCDVAHQGCITCFKYLLKTHIYDKNCVEQYLTRIIAIVPNDVYREIYKEMLQILTGFAMVA